MILPCKCTPIFPGSGPGLNVIAKECWAIFHLPRSPRFSHLTGANFTAYVSRMVAQTLSWTCWVWCLSAIAQAHPRNPSFRVLNDEDGLSHNSVYSIGQDAEGYMWFGTQNGLNRYDGYAFDVFRYDPYDADSLALANVSDMLVLPDGQILIATFGAGLAIYDPHQQRFVNLRPDPQGERGPPGRFVQAIHRDMTGRIWLGLRDGGLCEFDPVDRSFSSYRHDPDNENSLSHDAVWSISSTVEGHLWIGSLDGLCHFDPLAGTWTRFKHDPQNPNGLTCSQIREVFVDREQRLWVGTESGLNLRLPGDQGFRALWHDPNDPSSISHDIISCIFQDHEGTLWMGTVAGGLNQLLDFQAPNRAQFSAYLMDPTQPHALSHNDVRVIFEDRANVLWVGTRGGGVNQYLKRQQVFGQIIHAAGKPNSLADNDVTAICDLGEHILVGTENGGLDLLTPSSGRVQPIPLPKHGTHKLGPHWVMAITRDEQGIIWVATRGGGALQLDLDDQKVQAFTHDPNRPGSLSGNQVMSLLCDDRNRLWLGTKKNGLNRFERDLGTFSHMTLNRSSDQGPYQILLLFQDRSRWIWVGTDDGLVRMHPETQLCSWLRHDPQDFSTLSSDVIYCAHQDRRGRLWIGTFSGLNRMVTDSGSFERFYDHDGLPANEITGILEDDQGFLWLSTNRGLSRFDVNQRRFVNFDRSDGLLSNQFNRAAFCRASSGRFYFGSMVGLTCFLPDEIQTNTVPPPIVIQAFKVYDEPIPLEWIEPHVYQTTLRHNQNFFSLEFAALDYSAPERNRYAYQLEGVDKDWVHAGHRRYVSYTNLDGGKYTFRVRGSNNDGIWNQTGALLHLTIVPPFWKTTWFAGLSVALLALLMAGGYWWRVHRVEMINQSLQRQVEEKTRELLNYTKKMEAAHEEIVSIQNQLIATSTRASLVEMADGVLHNLGNLLNSISVSGHQLRIILSDSKWKGFFRAADLLEAHQKELISFLRDDHRGQNLCPYLIKLSQALQEEMKRLMNETEHLLRTTGIMRDSIDTQQQSTQHMDVNKHFMVKDLVDEALKLQMASLEKRHVRVEVRVPDLPRCRAPRLQLIHVLTNLIKNAQEAMDAIDESPGRLTIAAWHEGEHIHIRVDDTGSGMTPEVLSRLFHHGFTTKPTGHGFGLYACHRSMKDMGGRIHASSPGPGRGSTFTITFPISTE